MSIKTYRHKITGLPGQFPEDMAAVYPDLIEVADDAKPLAYTPIPAEKIAALRADANSATEPEGKQK